MNVMLAEIPYPNIPPEIFHLGPVSIRWYGVAYLTGFLLAYVMLRRLIKRGELRISVEALGDLIGYLALGVIVGGRTGWWLFYHKPEAGVIEKWFEPVAIWHGGMAFHGGLTGVLVVLFIWSIATKSPFWNIADCAARATPIGLFFGRIANFINGELVGRVTNVPWAIRFPNYSGLRHPSQIYEALLEGPVLFTLLWLYYRFGRAREGRVAAAFVMIYALIRFGVEYTREPDKQLGYLTLGLTRGQELSLAMLAVGAAMWLWRWRAEKNEAVAAPVIQQTEKKKSATRRAR